ncbi:PEP-CTERM sorting domain-containing protein [Aquabacterium lacunae]|uniref:PEP-CTERM sorting domain-containing protein n=2 Tax=Aquabacterium lacunae TaxID=2528630 RepID=A0A4Q9H2Q7_9BURK|nr:PEP-CTERM sorting domain-containing protein [Aquabacterium lacunae]
MITMKQISRAVVIAAAAATAHVAAYAATPTTVAVNASSLTSLGTVTTTKLGNATFAAGASNTGTLTLTPSSVSAALADYADADGFKISVSSLFLGTNSVSFSNFSQDLSSGMLSGSLVGAGGILGALNYSGELIDAATITTTAGAAGTSNIAFTNFTMAPALAAYLTAAGATPSSVPVGSMITNITVTGVPAVPEPSTYAMLLLGLGGIAVAARRKAA